LEWGFDMHPCSPSAGKKGYPYCGPNSLYEWEAPGAAGLTNRPRSMMYEYYDEKAEEPTMDIPTTANTLGFTTLVAALQAAKMDMLLSDPPNPGPLTVFAPSNEAFASLGGELLGCLVQPENVLVLQEILSYHYTYGKVLAGDLTNDQMIPMANGKDIVVTVFPGGVFININSAVVEVPDVPATNGVIHAIDTVLVPPGLDVTGFLAQCVATDPPTTSPPTDDIPTTANNLGFTTLVAALQAAKMDVLLSDPPNPGPLTVFAPSNDAFAKLGDELLGCLVEPENVLVLQEILSYHYTYGKVLAGDLTNDQMIPMANGKDIKITIIPGGVLINENVAVEVPNVPASNGVIHAIDSVLVPPGLDVTGFLEACLATDPPVPAPITPLTPAPQPDPQPEPTPSPTTKKSKSGKGGPKKRSFGPVR